MGLSEDELPERVKRWRTSNKRIVDFWYSIENSVLEVMKTGQAIGVRGLFLAREVDFNTNQHFFTVTLPSKRKLFYAQPFLQNNELGRQALYYRGINQETKKWENIPTYGGKLVENVVQAIARDCLAVSLQRLDAAGFQTVMHVHDEVILDVPVEFADIKTVTDIMDLPIEWAPGLLLRAEGYGAEFYRKE